MPKDYFSIENGTIAARLDQAWEDYKNKSVSTENRLKALYFMSYVFDMKELHNEINLNELLIELMEERESKKNENPNYIPTLTTGKYHFGKTAALTPTVWTKVSAYKELQSAFDAHTLLDINQKDKESDKRPMPGGITYITASQRAEFNIEIQNGLFKKNGLICDTSLVVAHHKPGYAAFTFNANGELHAFCHLGGRFDAKNRRLAHSSMNEGAPVLCAGEMMIKNGKLIRINTFSGHYEPSLYDVARFLGYLSDRGIDISKTQVYLRKKPHPNSGIKARYVVLNRYVGPDDPATPIASNDPWYEVPATDIVHSVKDIMKSNINSLDDYLKNNKTRLLRYANKLTTAKVKIANNFQSDLLIMMDAMQTSASLVDIKMQLECLDTILKRHATELANLKGKQGGLARKFFEMQTVITSELKKLENLDEKKEEERVEGFKKTY